MKTYTLTYATQDENGKLTQQVIPNQTKEECEIIYGNLTETIMIFLMEIELD